VKLADLAWKLCTAGLFGVWLTVGVTAAPALALTLAPTNPTIVMGQTQQFTTSGTVTATAVGGGAYFSCMSRSDGTAECWGRADGRPLHHQREQHQHGVGVRVRAPWQRPDQLLGRGRFRPARR
jgi:hypothetical protein